MAVYCTQADLEARLGVTAVALHLQASAGAVADAVALGSAQIDEFLLARYGAGLADSNWVRRACTTLACVALGGTNPPPDKVLLEYDRLMGREGKGGVLEKMQRGRVNVPDIAALGDVAPSVVNYHVREVPVPHVVAEPARSTTGQTVGPVRKAADPLWGDWGW
jgi:phage gp36-like protein